MERGACANPGNGQRCPSDLPTRFPLRHASSRFFGRVESALQDAGFNEPNLCRIFNLPSLAELDAVNLAAAQLEAVAEELTCYIRVFLLGLMVSRTITERVVSPSILQAFLELDLLRPGRCVAEDVFYATTFVYPVAGLLVATDRRNNPDHSPFATAVDAVYPPIFGGTRLFLRIMDKSPASDVLELCSGSGVGALVLSRTARQVTAVDITARAVHFARFNRLLNRCPNVEPVQGDLYDPVPDRTFDRIAAHPPSVP